MGYPKKTKNLTYTYTTRSFAGEIVEDPNTGKNRVKILHDAYYQTELNKFKVGTKISLKFTNQKPKRTEQQNRYYWGVYLPAIAAETGNDIDDLHELFKKKFLGKAIVEVLGEKIQRVDSTTDLSVSQFIEYIMRIEELTGVQAPPTDELRSLE